MAFIKPNLTRSWAGSALPAEVVDPGNSKYDSGWVAEIPAYQNFNYLQKTFTDGLGYFDEQGIGFWDPTVTYAVHAYTKGSNGTLYRSKGNGNINNDPIAGLTFWEPIAASRVLNTSTVVGTTVADALNTLNTGAAVPIAGHTGFRNMYIPTEEATEVNITGMPIGATLTIGNSGSGANFLYTALDALPTNCQALQFRVLHSLTSIAAGTVPAGGIRVETFSAWNFADATPTAENYKTYLNPSWNNVNDQINASNANTFWVPASNATGYKTNIRLDENVIQFAGTRRIRLQLVGFGI